MFGRLHFVRLLKFNHLFSHHLRSKHTAPKSISQVYRSQFYPQFPEAPYDFVCQIGDPILRLKCQTVEDALIQKSSFQNFLKQMWRVHENYGCAGLSAPQIGLPLRVAIIGVTKEQCDGVKSPLVYPLDRKVLINPVIKVLDYKSKITASEVCASVCSFSASVTRYTNIRVEALNEKGALQTWEASGFEARVIQHEIDHLDGLMYIDKMEPKSLECTAWQRIKMHKGKCSISFGPCKKSLLDRIKLF